MLSGPLAAVAGDRPPAGWRAGRSTPPAGTGAPGEPVFFLDSNVKPAPRSCRFLGPSHPHAVNGEWPQPLQGDGPEITPHRPTRVTVMAAVTGLWVVRRERASAELT